MKEIFIVVAFVLSSTVTVGTAHYLYLLLWRPEMANVPERELRRWPAWRRAWMWVSIGSAFIGVGFMLYKGIEAALWFIPKDWRSINEDGESEWVGHGIALIVAYSGALFGLSKLSELAAIRSREFWTRPVSGR